VVESFVKKEGKYMNLVKRLIKEEEGQGMIEYVLIVALISIAAILVMGYVSGSINGVWEEVNSTLDDTTP